MLELHQLGRIVMANKDMLDLASCKDEIERLSLYGVGRMHYGNLEAVGRLAIEHAVSFESLSLHDRIVADRLLLAISRRRASRALAATRRGRLAL